jgi:hypothetical protein
VLDVLLLLLPFHAEGWISQHVVEGAPFPPGLAVEAVLREGVAEDDVVGVFALDEHVGLADRPGLVVPVLAEEMRIGVGVEVADVALRCDSGSWAGRRPSLADYVAVREPGAGQPRPEGCSCCLRSRA